jgi:hypothetical protein
VGAKFTKVIDERASMAITPELAQAVIGDRARYIANLKPRVSGYGLKGE